MNVFRKALTLLIGNTDDLKYLKISKQKDTASKLTERELIGRESAIGRELFGPILKGHQREFFCLDEKTCIWYEEYKDAQGKAVSMTTRYEIHGDKIMKIQGAAQYSYLEGTELDNVVSAIRMYYDRVMRSLYNRDPETGHFIA